MCIHAVVFIDSSITHQAEDGIEICTNSNLFSIEARGGEIFSKKEKREREKRNVTFRIIKD